MPWQAIHVHYSDDNQDRLILDAVRPLFERVAADVPEAYFTPHWRRGPHLRLLFRAGDEVFHDVVRPAARDVVGAFLRDRPATTKLDEARVLPLHERLAEREGEKGPLRPFQPNNTLTVERYDPRLHMLGNRETAELQARFYVAATPLAFAMIEGTPDPGDRRRLAFALLIATVHAFTATGLAQSYATFRSHAEAFLATTPGGEEYRSEWDAQYTRYAERFETELVEALATVDGHRDSVPFLRQWVDTMRPVERDVRALQHVGTLHMPPADLSAPRSEFHRALAASPGAAAVLQGPEFTVFRQLINYFYLHLTRIGLSAMERNALCHIAANTAERHYGMTALEMFAASLTDTRR
ncbi:thiopeptide maturation pyridine synthase [Streptomonospora wellingtoniae]|uniref:Lantibiotic dehydratase C-terminal domain-containing protein n=1 Tax=Streptomonospora wellingtoniae TaxID=3075544 RepID=A0ABU2KWB3_9ACTN|nr:thiopeptide maturation pyridine synthase [Streptomonospora sp. DSM 45055]MDT0303590.1 lantibiotic dehydratase C-terminal domain-containing protein [Streptomonospora sp. DSM 45055]